MGGVSVDSGGGGGGKKSVDAQINMVPMIDLLVSCIAFLLMTAVWVQTGSVQASQPRAPSNAEPQENQTPQEQLKIQISPTGFRVGVNAADMRDVGHTPQRFDELRTMLRTRLEANQQNREVWLQPDTAVHYGEIVRVMDVIYDVYGSPSQNPANVIRFL